jgi:hypothetical protein
MTEAIPPLPDLEIDGMSKKRCNQETIDQALLIIYERRPDLYAKMGRREKMQSDPNKEIANEVLSFVRDELHIVDSLVQPQVFWEMRRRARLMYGLPI